MKKTKITSALSPDCIDFHQSKRSIFTRGIILLSFLLFISNTNATIKTAVGNSGQGWSNAGNWSPSGVPQNGDTVVIPASFTLNVKGGIYSTPYPRLVIKVYGTLFFEPAGKIELSNTAAVGIYSGGLINSTGAASSLINIGGVSKFNGSVDGSIPGPRYANASTGGSPNGFNPGVLAIKLVSFNYQKINNAIKLNWTASHSNDNDYFEIQRSRDGNNWIILSSLPVKGNLHEINSYTTTDLNPDRDLNFYRIRLVNFDMHDSYSKTIAVHLSLYSKILKIFPNPAQSEAKIYWENFSSGPVNITVMNAAMSTVLKLTASENENFVRINVKNLPSGIYTIIISDLNNHKECSRLIVNNN